MIKIRGLTKRYGDFEALKGIDLDVAPGEFLVVLGPSGAGKSTLLRCVTLHTLVPGDLAGELSFIDGTERYASLMAEGSARVLSLRRPAFESLLKSEPEIVYRTLRAIVRTAHAIQRRLSSQSIELTNYIYKQHGRY